MKDYKNIQTKINDYIMINELSENEIFKNIDFFLEINRELYFKCKDYLKFNENLNSHKFKKGTLFEQIDLIKEFYKLYDYEIDIDNLINNGTIDFTFNIDKITFSGMNFYDGLDDGFKAIEASNNGLVLDSVVLVHELSHYNNQTNYERNLTNDTFTESIAYAEELIFLDFLRKKGYEIDVEIMLKKLIVNIFGYTNESFAIFKMFYLYEKLSSISHKSYESLFKDDLYNFYLELLEFSFEEKIINLNKRSGYVLGYLLGIGMFQRVKENHQYLKTIKSLNYKMNELSVEECLEIIEFRGIDEELIYVDQFINDIYDDSKGEKVL